MKIKNSVITAVAILSVLTGCHKPDELVRESNENVMTLTVKGTLLQNGIEYDAVIDNEDYTITLNFPYYISDTEAILSDLTEVKLRAVMPLGARFEPGLSGIHDLSEAPFVTTLVYETGERVPYTVRGIQKKSDVATIAAATLTDEDVKAVISITDPTDDNPEGKITVLKTSAAVEDAIRSVKITPASWATIAAPGYDPEVGVVDLNYISEIIVTSQDGTAKAKYNISIEQPTLVEPGKIGYISNLFGIQCTAENTYGFEADANYTMAVVDKYLVISNKNDFTRMTVLNRFSGRHMSEITVNTTGIDPSYKIRAIDTDDAGKLVAFTYVNTREVTQSSIDNGHDLDVTPTAIKAWVWNNGLESAPTMILDLAIDADPVKSLTPALTEIGNTISVKGSLESGRAVITTVDKFASRCVAFFFASGQFTEAKIYCPSSNGVAQWAPSWNSSKAIPLNDSDPLYFAYTSGNQYQTVCYYTATAMTTLAVPGSYWWKGNGAYDKVITGVDLVDFNGTQLIAISNGYGVSSYTTWYHRMYVANIGYQPASTALSDGFIFDTREGPDVPGTGYSPAGMSSTFPFDATQSALVSTTQLAKRGDVVFKKSDDGNSVQVYMMNMNAGVLGYEITRYNM